MGGDRNSALRVRFDDAIDRAHRTVLCIATRFPSGIYVVKIQKRCSDSFQNWDAGDRPDRSLSEIFDFLDGEIQV